MKQSEEKKQYCLAEIMWNRHEVKRSEIKWSQK